MTDAPIIGTAKVFVVLNPVAGQSQPEEIRRVVSRHFADRNITYHVHQTSGQERLSEVVQAALDKDFNLFVAAGGDGTVSGVAAGVAETGIPLGIIPVGTGNALARELRIPLDPAEALNLLTGAHAIRRIDAMRREDQFFTLTISVGLSALTMRETGPESKRRFGRLAYIWAGLRGLVGYQPQRFTLTVDGQRHRVRASELAVVNAGILGGTPLRWGPHIRLDDGRVDIAIVRLRNAFDYTRLGWDLLLNRQKQDPHIRFLRARDSIEIASDRPLSVQGDGEFIGQTPVQIQVVPRAIHVICKNERS